MALDPSDVTGQTGSDDSANQPSPAPDVSALPATTQTQGNAPPLPQQQQQGPPRPGLPIVADLIRNMIKPRSPGVDPATGVMRPPSRLDAFENFLGSFVSALGQGFSQAGHGPGSFSRGFGAAATAPYQQSLQQYQLQQAQQAQQAQIGSEQAKAQLTRAQAAPVNVPLGPNGESVSLPAGSVPTIYRGYGAAQQKSQSDVQIAGMKIGAMKELNAAKTAHEQAAADLAEAGNDPTSPVYQLKKQAYDLSLKRLEMAVQGLNLRQQANARDQEKFELEKGAGQFTSTTTERGAAGQADIVKTAGDQLISDIKANRGKFGNTGAILNAAFLGTPLSDPPSQKLAAEISSFAALNPRMHGFRGQNALAEFQKLLGGLPNNPDALIAGIQSIQSTANIVSQNVTNKIPQAVPGGNFPRNTPTGGGKKGSVTAEDFLKKHGY